MKEHYKNIGKKVSINIGGLHFEVEIADVRQAFGRIDYQVKPIAGHGEKWIDSATVKIRPESE